MSRFSALSFVLTLAGIVLILMAYSSSMTRAEDSVSPTQRSSAWIGRV